LGQRGLGVAEPVADGGDVGAVVRGEDLRTEGVIADETARDRVAIRGASAIRVDVRLDREPVPGMEPIGELASAGDDRDRGLVAEARRLRRKILTVELRMFAAE